MALLGSLLIWSGISTCFNAGFADFADGAGREVHPAGMVLVEDPPGDSEDKSPSSDDSLFLSSGESFRFEKVILDTGVSDKYKLCLLSNLAEAGWDGDDIALVRRYLADPRAQFRPSVLKTNVTHEETEELYLHHLAPSSVDKCMDFYRVEGVRIARASKPYGIPPELIVAILKVESNFGSHKGSEPVFNVFWSLSIGDCPLVLEEVLTEQGEALKEQRKRLLKRARWGRSQLLELVKLARSGAGDRLMWDEGSWAGAFGLPQFIPTSYTAYARDGDNDGSIDLHDIDDATASIAYYLKSNGWKKNIDYKRKKRVLMRYNISSHYAECVLALTDSIKRRGRGL